MRTKCHHYFLVCCNTKSCIIYQVIHSYKVCGGLLVLVKRSAVWLLIQTNLSGFSGSQEAHGGANATTADLSIDTSVTLDGSVFWSDKDRMCCVHDPKFLDKFRPQSGQTSREQCLFVCQI